MFYNLFFIQFVQVVRGLDFISAHVSIILESHSKMTVIYHFLFLIIMKYPNLLLIALMVKLYCETGTFILLCGTEDSPLCDVDTGQLN